MIRVLVITVVAVSTVACASQTKFQKSEDNGYQIADSSSKDRFTVTVRLPSESSDRRRWDFAYRAVGEECLVRGFSYFEPVLMVPRDAHPIVAEGLCFPGEVRKAMGIGFAQSGLNENPVRLVIESLNSKTNSKLQVGDEVLEFKGRTPVRNTDMKLWVFEAAPADATAKWKIRRSGKVLEVDEPYAQTSGLGYGPKDLESVRRDLP
ncbi:MAG: hypothetical protein V4692_00665 [Bdellovibrionota bacterium]